MEGSNKDLFKYYCDIAELPATEQKNYIESLKAQQPEFATKLEALVKSDSDLTQVFSDAILDFTDEENLISVGDRLTNYKLTQALGNGGMGQVFKAERCDGKIDQSVAIKFLHPLFYEYQSGKLLLQEAQALAQLNHPNIASIYDIAETDNGNAYIIMEYVEGVTLDVYLQQNDLSVDKKLKLFNQIADAVLEAHNHQIIHADIKPSNVLITASGQAKLIDFGVMQLAGELTQTAPKLVTHYLCAMTVNYASPEQLNGKKATISSDIYGLGGLLYFMLSGRSPFENVGGTLTSKIEYINNQAPENCALSNKVTFKSDIIGILHKSLAKAPKDRYRTVTDLINEIKAFQQSKVVSVSESNHYHNIVKFLYRNRVINVTLTSVFIVFLSAFIQINSKNQQIAKEKQSLLNISEELKRTYSQRDKTLADSELEGEVLYLPDSNKLEPEQYVEIMLLMFDSFFYQENVTAYSRLIDSLTKWTNTRNNIDELTLNIIRFRAALSESNKQEMSKNYKKSEKYLSIILSLERPLDERVIDLLQFKNQEELTSDHYISKLLERLERDIDISTLSIQRQYLFYNAKGFLYKDKNYELAERYLNKAYDLAKNNSKEVKLWRFVDTTSILHNLYHVWKGPQYRGLDKLRLELIELIPRLDRKTRFYAENLGELIRIEIKYSIKNVANIFEKNDIDFTTSMKGHSPSQALIYRYYSIFLNVLGDYENAGKLALKAKGIIAEDSGVKNSYYIYYLTALAYTKLEQGSSVGAIPIIEQSIIPFTRLHDTKDFLGFYQTEFCYRLALLENTKRLKELCFDGFKNTTDILGKGNYWSNYAASGVIAWYTMNPSDEKEKQYITLLESDFEELHNKEKVRRGFILERYFISRKNIEKSSHYQDIVEQAMDDYYGSVDAINRYYHQIMAAELALLNKDSATAKQHLSEVKVKLCGLGEQNPHRIKYIKLTKSLSMSTCGAI